MSEKLSDWMHSEADEVERRWPGQGMQTGWVKGRADEVAALETEIDELKAKLEATELDRLRMDWLVGESEMERKSLNSLGPLYRSLFRRNVPITRSAIDEAITAVQKEEEG